MNGALRHQEKTAAVNVKFHGNAPYTTAVLHGGPGAAGGMAPVAHELSSICGVLEPLQTRDTIAGQLAELETTLLEKGTPPMVLVGFSWGAWLGYMLAARYPHLVKKLVLVSSGSFDEKYSKSIMDIRLSRLNEKERTEVQTLMKLFGAPSEGDENKIMARLGQLMDRADSYDPLPDENWNQEIRSDIYQGVWPIAAELRRSGKLLEMGNKIQCPVTAIHGDYDPHMYKGVEEPLSRILTDFHFYLLDRCGHSPWQERQAHKRFYEILKREITDVFPGVG